MGRQIEKIQGIMPAPSRSPTHSGFRCQPSLRMGIASRLLVGVGYFLKNPSRKHLAKYPKIRQDARMNIATPLSQQAVSLPCGPRGWSH